MTPKKPLPIREFKGETPFWFQVFYISLGNRDVFSQKTGAIIKATGKSREYVCRLFKKSTGETLGDYLNNLRIEHACKLLATTDIDIIDVALDAGFENLSTFYHLFRSRKQTSPKQYRIDNSNN